MRQIKILFIVSEDWYFVSHRLDVAIKAIECGYSVALLSHFSDSRDKINKLGIETLDWSLNRSSKNLFKEWSAVQIEAKRNGSKAQVARIFKICVEKNSELPKGNELRKF